MAVALNAELAGQLAVFGLNGEAIHPYYFQFISQPIVGPLIDAELCK